MNAFYVGQRVRVAHVFKACNAYLEGREGVVTEIVDGEWGALFGLDISPIELWVDELCGAGFCGFRASQLEPIIPPGLESPEEINALYEPEPMRVRESQDFALELCVAGICRECGR